ncbi:MAG TPA: hypothetical protein VMX13_10750 [Sedimentisphaerales bacterium]|nr:hypothetical protein [Sedimentisphaerales bacterium]
MAEETKQSRPGTNDGRQTDEIQAAIEYGIDVSMLVDNLARSCTERIIRHQAALNTEQKLRKARRL